MPMSDSMPPAAWLPRFQMPKGRVSGYLSPVIVLAIVPAAEFRRSATELLI